MLDEQTGRFVEVDQIKLRRVAKVFHEWLMKVDPKNDPFNYLQEDLPLVQAALDGTLKLPYKGDDPHNWEVRERLIPREYISVSSPFYNTIRAEHSAPPETIEREGKRYAWMNFEEPGDVF